MNVREYAFAAPNFFRSSLRGKVQHLLLRPDSALQYLDKVNEVADDFIDMIRRKRDKETFVYPADDFLFEVSLLRAFFQLLE